MNELYIKRFTEEDDMPLGDGQYPTDLGYLEVFCGKWVDVDEEPEWWLEEYEEEESEDTVTLPTTIQDETFIEQEISYQHHTVVRMAIFKYKVWLKERKLETEK